MNIVLLFLLVVFEIGLPALTFLSGANKTDWRKLRLLFNAAELVLALVFLLFPSVDLSLRFLGLYVILVLRFLVSLIGYFRHKGRSEKPLKKFPVIHSAVRSILLFIFGLSFSFLIRDYTAAPPTGSFPVNQASVILVDTERADPFEAGSTTREVPVHFFYPDTTECENCPLVVFSHGAFGYYQSNYSTYAELASHGYVVAALDHPHHSFFTKNSAGKTVTVDPVFLNEVMFINSGDASEQEIFDLSTTWLKLRTDDMNFVLDSLVLAKTNGMPATWAAQETPSSLRQVLSLIDMDHIGVMGHSLGGAASVSLGRMRSDISAVIDLDGTMMGEQTGVESCDPYDFEERTYTEISLFREDPYPVPLLSVDNEEHHNSRLLASSINMPYANNVVFEHAEQGYETWFVGAGHMNFTDLPRVAPFLAKMLGTGSVDVDTCIDTMNSLVLSFFDCYLKGDGTFQIEESYGN